MAEMAHPHSPEELAMLSTVAHNVIGWLLLLVAGAMLWETLKGAARSRWRLLWPAVGMVIGLGLTAFVFLHFIFYHRVSPFADPAQNQHQVLGILAGSGATVEFVRRLRDSSHRGWQSVWPLSLVAVGVTFLIHEQGTAEALLIHWALAATFIVAGLSVFAVILSGDGARSLTVFGVLLLSAAAVQLIFFTEKPGAHGDHGKPPGSVDEPKKSHGDAGGDHSGH